MCANGRKGGTATQILAREGALERGALPDDAGQPTNKAAVDWWLRGAEEGTRDMTWEEIEEGADKLRVTFLLNFDLRETFFRTPSSRVLFFGRLQYRSFLDDSNTV